MTDCGTPDTAQRHNNDFLISGLRIRIWEIAFTTWYLSLQVYKCPSQIGQGVCVLNICNRAILPILNRMTLQLHHCIVWQ